MTMMAAVRQRTAMTLTTRAMTTMATCGMATLPPWVPPAACQASPLAGGRGCHLHSQ